MNFVYWGIDIIQAIWRFRFLVVVLACTVLVAYTKWSSNKDIELAHQQNLQQIEQIRQDHEREMKRVIVVNDAYAQQVEQLTNEHLQQVNNIVNDTPRKAKKILETFNGNDSALWGTFAREYDIKIQ